MPKFDLKSWTDLCSNETINKDIKAGIKEWNAHCPEEYDDVSTDPKKFLATAAATAKKFTGVILGVERRLPRPMPNDRKGMEKFKKASTLLDKWQAEATKYVADVTKWSQEAAKEETEERKLLWKAQAEFAAELIGGFEIALKKLDAPYKDFEAAMKARKLDVAAVKFDLHRQLMTEAAYHLRPIAIAKVREKVSHKFKVPINHLAIPPQFNALAPKVKKADDRDEDMQERLEKGAEAEASGDAEPESTNPAYRKAVREIVNAFKGDIVKMKGKVASAAQCFQTAQKIRGVSVADNVIYPKAVSESRALNEKMFTIKKEAHVILDQMRNPNSPMHKKIEAAGIGDADYKKTLLPQVNAALAFARRLIGLNNQISRTLEEWLHEVVKAHPEAQEAKAELSNMSGKYNVRLI